MKQAADLVSSEFMVTGLVKKAEGGAAVEASKIRIKIEAEAATTADKIDDVEHDMADQVWSHDLPLSNAELTTCKRIETRGSHHLLVLVHVACLLTPGVVYSLPRRWTSWRSGSRTSWRSASSSS